MLALFPKSGCILREKPADVRRERMQSGRRPDGFDGGVLSPYRDSVQQHFAGLVSNAILTGSDIKS